MIDGDTSSIIGRAPREDTFADTFASQFLYPKVMAEMVDAIQRGARDGSLLASLRTVACGGSAAPASSLKAFEALLPVYTKLRSSYGTTEIFSMTALPPHVPLVPGFVGCYAPGVEVL